MDLETEDFLSPFYESILILQELFLSIPPATLCYVIISLVPPVATFLYFWGLEYWTRLPLADRLWPWVVFISASYAILLPPELPGYLAIIFGPGSVIHIIRAIELGFVLDVPKLARLRKTKASGAALYAWESYPPPLTIHRGIWLIDLMTSIRGIGWSHGPRNRLPPPSLTLDSRSACESQKGVRGTHEWNGKDVRRFLSEKAVEVILCYLWIDTYQSIIIRSSLWQSLARPTGWGGAEIPHKVFSWLLTPWVKWIPVKICIYATIQLSCSLLAFVDVGLGFLGNEPWKYPPIFGSSIAVMRVNFQGMLTLHRDETGLNLCSNLGRMVARFVPIYIPRYCRLGHSVQQGGRAMGRHSRSEHPFRFLFSNPRQPLLLHLT